MTPPNQMIRYSILEFPQSIGHLIRTIEKISKERKENCYLVGGFVRDWILKVPNADLDIAVEGDGNAFARELALQTQATLKCFERFETSTLGIQGGGKLDVSTCRSEVYDSEGELPRVTRSNIQGDLFRRDFTVNAMALKIQSRHFLELIDPFHGKQDLKSKILRALHAKSFLEDPTRIFRASRFQARWHGKIHPQTQRWILDAVQTGCLTRVSAFRIWKELHLIWNEPYPSKILDQLQAWKTFKPWNIRYSGQIFPSKVRQWVKFFNQKFNQTIDPRDLYFLDFFSGWTSQQMIQWENQFPLSRLEKRLLNQWIRIREDFQHGATMSWSQKDRVLKKIHPAMQAFLCLCESEPFQPYVVHYFRKITSLTPWIQMKDLVRDNRFIPSQYTEILSEALGKQVEKKFPNQEQLLKWLHQRYGSK
jgi:tRNA nucleotidyltransferase/poly(A) polymerase